MLTIAAEDVEYLNGGQPIPVHLLEWLTGDLGRENPQASEKIRCLVQTPSSLSILLVTTSSRATRLTAKSLQIHSAHSQPRQPASLFANHAEIGKEEEGVETRQLALQHGEGTNGDEPSFSSSVLMLIFMSIKVVLVPLFLGQYARHTHVTKQHHTVTSKFTR